MPQNWKTYKLSEIFNIIGGGTPKTSIDEYWNGEIPWLSVVDFNNDQRIVNFTEKSITKLGLEKSSTKLLQKGQLIVSARGTVGELAQLGRDMTFNQSCYGLNGKDDLLINDYGYYLMKQSVIELKSNSHGSVFDTITRNTFDNIEVNLPSIKEQTQIASILSALDDKIELNLQQNKTLEEMAMALYKHWFVDFGPFQDGEFVESELGMIPKGWEVKRIGDIASVIDCLHSKKPELLSEENENIFLQLKNILDNGLLDLSTKYYVSDKDYSKWTSRIEVRFGDCIITNVGRSGAVARIPDGFNGAIGRNITAIRLNEEFFFPGYFITMLSSDSMKGTINKYLDEGTILKALNVKSIPLLHFFVPKDLELMQKLERSFENYRFRMESNLSENQTLTNLRDTLLPKLISGQIRVKDAEKILKDHV